jgi:hypothetical protein
MTEPRTRRAYAQAIYDRLLQLAKTFPIDPEHLALEMANLASVVVSLCEEADPTG